MAARDFAIDSGGMRDTGPVNGSRDEAIYKHLYAAIVDHHLAPGTKLPEDTLAEAFTVSRTRIRKVLHRLAYERLVEVRINRGAAVAQPTVNEARDVFATRRIIECGAIEQVSANATPEKLAALAAGVRRELDAHARGDRRESIRLSGDFHVALCALSGNDAITHLLAGLVARTSLVIATYGMPMAGSCRHSEHDEVLELLGKSQVDAAREWMDQHLRDVERSVVFPRDERAPTDLKTILNGVGGRLHREH